MKNKVDVDLMKQAGVYIIRNHVNGKVYVGSTVCFRLRLNSHKSQLSRFNHNNKGLQNAYHRDGADAFSFSLLEVIYLLPDEKNEDFKARLFDLEYQYINRYKSSDRRTGYNLQADPRNPLLDLIKIENELEVCNIDKSTIPNRWYGEHNNKSKLSIEQVKAIKILFLKNRSVSEVVSLFPFLTREAIRCIKNGQTWVEIQPTRSELDTYIVPEFDHFKGKRVSAFQVKQIKYLHLKGGSIATINKFFGCQSVSEIVRGKTRVDIALTPNEVGHLDKTSLYSDFEKYLLADRATKSARQLITPNSKLSVSDVLKIADALKIGSKSEPLAKKYNVSAATVRGIASGKIWSHLTMIKKGDIKLERGKLTNEQRSQIKHLSESGQNLVLLSIQFGVSLPNIYHIVKGY